MVGPTYGICTGCFFTSPEFSYSPLAIVYHCPHGLRSDSILPDRYFVESPVTSDRAILGGAEAHHLLHVMRAKVGMGATLFDGSGCEFDAVVERLSRSEVEMAIRARHEIDREAAVVVTLGVALPKGDRQKWLVEKIVELGVARLVPLQAERGVAQPVENALERLRRGVIEASKQCGRNRLMEIAESRAWDDFLHDNAAVSCRMVAHPRSDPARGTCHGQRVAGDSVVIAIGPEGGFSDRELALAAEQGWQTVDLGRRILRVETAAVALAAMVIGTIRSV